MYNKTKRLAHVQKGKKEVKREFCVIYVTK